MKINKYYAIFLYFWFQTAIWADDFVAVKIPKKNTVSAEKMIVIAYVSFFVLILGYILFITKKLSLIDNKLKKLELIENKEEE